MVKKSHVLCVLIVMGTLTRPTVQACVPSAGMYCPSPTAVATTCPAGYYCTGDVGNDITACPLNTYRSGTGGAALVDCSKCDQYTVTSNTASSACHVCAAGTRYTYSAEDFADGACAACAVGTHSAANATSCSECEAGTYAGAAGSSTCKPCRPGTYQEEAGAVFCQACDSLTYTYTEGLNGHLNVVWGADNASACATLPGFAKPLVCLPGSYLDVSGCVLCPFGYYCPELTWQLSNVNSVQTCGMTGSMAAGAGAMSSSDCVVPALLEPYAFETCSIAPAASEVLSALSITAMTTSYSSKTVFFTTNTAVYRVLLESSTVELIAGVEGTTGSSSGIGTQARFSALRAIGVDQDGPEAGVIVVGDGNAVRMINVFSREVVSVGVAGQISQAGGIALRRDTGGNRFAYVSDVLRHAIIAFNLDNFQSFLVAGDANGFAGRLDGDFPSTALNAPKGLAFLEKAMNSSKLLLVADSGNNRIRVVDTELRTVSTWFKPLDRVSPELVNPVAVSVGMDQSGLPLVYVTSGSGEVSVLQYPLPSDRTIKVLTKVDCPVTGSSQAIFVYGTASVGANNAVAFSKLLVLEGTTIKSLVQDSMAGSAAAGGDVSQCHLPCTNSDCSALSSSVLCGNSFLDAGEECDDGFSNPNSGCNMTTCKIRAGYVCPVGLTACHAPEKGYMYVPTGVYYREADCAALTPRTGYTIDSHCVETDINECTEGTATTCDIQAKCLNTEGAYTCECFDTFFGDGQTCVRTAYAVYSVLDIASIPSSVLVNPTESNGGEGVVNALKRTYAAILSSGVPANTANSFAGMNISELATWFTTVSVDPTISSYTRLEIVTLFETSTVAALVAASTSPSSMQTAMSQAVFSASSGVVVFQKPKVRVHRSSSFSESNVIDGWGMNITSVNYNRTCVVNGVTPTGGCWQVEMIYVGGQELPKSNENPNDIQQSKNVLYLPRLDHDAISMQLSTPAQALTMNAGMFFPCEVGSSSAAGKGITAKATACCLRNLEASYRPHADFAKFLNSSKFKASVPLETCMSGEAFNDTFPESNIVFQLPDGDGATNDLVVGKIEGMPHSEVRLLETIDYTTRTFKVQLVLEEGDLRMSAALMKGVWGLEYNMTFFVGLANFKGTGTSIMNTRNSVQFITVSKSSVLTLSTFGANQDPLVSSVDMQLIRIKVTDFFQPVSYLYYLQPVFTMPTNFKSPLSGTGAVVPLNSIRMIKALGLPSNSDPGWMQACASADGQYVYANTSLQSLVQRAQAAECVQSNLQMCYPPSKANNVISFGVPLPLDFIKSNEYSSTDPYTLTVQFMVQAYDTVAMSNVWSTMTMTVDITPMGFTAICETMSASQTLADIIQGNIYIGTATNDYEWDTTLQKKTNIDVPGTTPSNSFEFAATTVQGAVMTFAALGDSKYFEDARSLTQEVHVHDIHTVHFLEPLGGKSGPSPNFDAVKALFLAGTAFVVKVDAGNHSEWLEPSRALLNLCPYKATVGKMACLTRSESTFKNTAVKRDVKHVVELRQNDSSSVDEMKGLMSQVMMQGGVNDFTNELGIGFYNELSTKLSLNNRYRKAYVVNPVMEWSFEAMQTTQKGSTAYTVCSKIIAIGMITIRTPEGTQLARRLLSTEMMAEVPPQVWYKEHSAQMLRRDVSLGWQADESTYEAEEGMERRRLLQYATGVVDTGMQASKTQTGNSMVLNVDVPGYDATSQLCNIVLAAPYSRCNIVELRTQVVGAAAVQVCNAEQQGTLSSELQMGIANKLITSGISHINGVALLEYTIDGCEAVLGAGRRLLAATQTYTILTQKIITSSENGTATLTLNELQYLQYFFNSTSWSNVLGGGGQLQVVTISFVDIGGNEIIAKIDLGVKTTTNTTKDDVLNKLNESFPDLNIKKDVLFQDDTSRRSSSGAQQTVVVGLNLALFCSVLLTLFFMH